MTQEEKAKAYDEALERAKNEYQTHKSFNGFCEMLARIFPELKESDGEKTRRTLLQALKDEAERIGDDREWYSGITYKSAIAWLEKQVKTMPEDIKEEEIDNGNKVETKFKVGDWVVTSYGKVNQVIAVDEDVDGFTLDDGTYFSGSWKDSYHLWAIQDAKDGDVLAYETDEEDLWIMIYWSLYEPYEGHVHYHALLVNDNFSDKGTCCICINDLKPATKEQRDTLMKAMADAGWEFDFEKKELKKIEEEVNGEDYGIDGLWHAQRILEETLGEVEGYQTDDGILEHKAAITAVKKLYEQKPAEWSEEDEIMKIHTLQIIKKYWNSLPDTDYSENEISESCYNWLKSLKERYTWKPSDEQITWLYRAADDASKDSRMKQILNELLSDLKKLKGE